MVGSEVRTGTLGSPQILEFSWLENTFKAMWKPAYDFLLTWSSQMGDSYRDVIQELHTGLDKMKNPITKRWKHLTGTLILVNSLDMLRAAAFSPQDHEDFAI
uniref:SH3BP4 C-terminal helical domain-containing protein n=1 Tax=Serinus canaria TaxID=9135 RepID=A0A8C9UD53_SERCA